MDLRQLSALLAVAEHSNFTDAARSLHTVQSNVSAHISRLEREVGTTLIDRARRELTPEGEVVADRARRILVELQGISDDLASMGGSLTGTVRLGVIGTAARWIVPPLMDVVRRQHRHLEVIVVDATTTSLLTLLVQNRLDLAMVNLPVNDRDIKTEALFTEQKVVVVPDNHELADRERVDLSELAQYELLLAPQGTAFRDEIDADARAAQLELRPWALVDGLILLASLAFQGFAPALLPAGITLGDVPTSGWRSVAVDRLSPRQVGLARNRRVTSPAPAQAVAKLISVIVRSEVQNRPHMQHSNSEPSLPDTPEPVNNPGDATSAEARNRQTPSTNRANTKRANTNRASTNRAKAGRANTSRAKAGRAKTTRAKAGRANTNRANASRANASQKKPTGTGESNANPAPPRTRRATKVKP